MKEPIRFRFLLPNAVRITHADADGEIPEDRPWLEAILPPTLRVPPEERTLRVTTDRGILKVYTRDQELIVQAAQPAQIRRNDAIEMAFRMHPGEGFYGGGEWFNAFRRERGTVRLKARESLAPTQGWRTYSTIPLFLSDRGYAIFLLNSHESTWRIDPRRGELRIQAAGPPADYVVIYGPSFKEILHTYTALTGRPPLVPRWAFGLWVTGYPQAHQDDVVAHVAEHRRREIPLDAVILDYHWEDRFHNFRWRPEIVPEPDRLIDDLKGQGARLGLIITPFQNDRNRLWMRRLTYLLAKNAQPEMLDRDERALAEYEEGRRLGYFAHERAVWWFGGGGMVDFTNPQAVAWWGGLMRPLYEQGVAFFKNDDGEYLPDDARSHIGIDGREYHNIYGFFYGRAIYEGMLRLDDRRPLIYARSVWAGSQRYPALFLGDQKPTFKHVRSTMRAGLNLGLAGFAYWTADVFGLDGETTPETHMRYAQWALMSPVARYFIRPPQVDGTRLPWSHGPEEGANFRTYASLRSRLLPTYCALAWEAHGTGLPIIRPMMLEFQDDQRMAGIADQAMLGDRLMVAPVIEAGATARRIVLPEGTWHDFWTDRTWKGGTVIDYDAPLERLPLLVRGGSILLLGPVLQHIPDDHRFDELEVHCWPPYPATALLYDDDGTTRAYQQGSFSVTHIAVNGNGPQVTVRISAVDGDFSEQVSERKVTVVLHRAPAPTSVRVNGRAIGSWTYEPTKDHVAIPVRCSVEEETILTVAF
jgi:alpha-glucosidase (family GH31 glycosyl hydrolase)